MTKDEVIKTLVDALKLTTAALEHRWMVIANRAAPVMESVIDDAHTAGVQALAAARALPNEPGPVSLLDIHDQLWGRTSPQPTPADVRDAELLDALRPFSKLLQEHHSRLPDSQPIYGVGDSLITVGDMRRARAAIDAARGD